MIVYDKEQKEIVIPNGIGNIDIYNNGVEAGYNEGYEQGQADIAAKARVLEVTKNGVYGSEASDPIIPDVTGVYADGTEFYNCAELTGIQYNTGIKVSKNTKLEIWYKPKDSTFRNDGGLIGLENTNDIKNFSLYTYLNRGFAGKIFFTNHIYTPEDRNKWFHIELSLNEGFFVDGVNYGTYQLDGIIPNKDIYINKYVASADGYFGMIKINDTIIIPTADGFLNTNTGELLEVVRDGEYTFIKNEPIYGEGELIKTVYVNVPDLNGSYDEGYAQGKTDGINEQKSKLESINITENGTYTKEDGYNEIVVDVPTGGGDKPIPPQDGWGMTGVFNDWGGSPDIPFNENGEWDGRPYKVIRNFEATGGEFKIRRNNDVTWTDVYTANFYDIPQFALLRKDDFNMYIDDGVWDIYLFFGNDGVPNEMLILHSGTDLSTIKYEYTLTISTDKENAIIDIVDGYTNVWDGYSDMYDHYCGGSATVTMKLGNSYNIYIHMEGYEDIYEDLVCRNDEEKAYTLTKIEGYGCNFISPIVFSKDAGNTINAKNVQIPTFVYEGNQYYNIDSFNLADIEEFKIQILFKPNNSGDTEPINIFGCETPEVDSTAFGARIYRGEIEFQIDRHSTREPYTENTWYNVEMGYNATKRWVIVNGSTLFDEEHTGLTKPSQTLMIGAINKGGNALRPFYGKIAATYIKSNANQVWLLPKENGTMDVYWNNLINRRNSISGENNARFENENLSGDGMKSITWLGNLEDKWVTPSMSERDDNGFIVVSPSEGYNGLKRTVINPQTIYNEGLEAGKTNGINEQKSKLESISITENGTYTKEDGYNHIEVNVPDLNGSYDEGYTQGQADAVTNARVLNVTENGVYKSKFSDPIIPANYTVTGVYDDSTRFYSYAELNGKVFNTKIAGSVDSRLEFWYKGDNTLAGDAYNVIIGSGNNDDSDCFQVRYDTFSNSDLLIGVGNTTINVSGWDDTAWHYLIISKAEGLWIDGEKKGDFSPTNTINGEFFINGIGYDINSDRGGTRNANGCFGMIKIDDTTIIPTADGFKNVNTGELLEVVKDGTYTFTENLPIYAEGELYKTINVNVVPQISIKEAGLNVWYNDLTRITDENEVINSDWSQALQGETIQNVFPGISMTISGQAVAKPFFIDRVNGNSTATKIGKLVSKGYGTPKSCPVVIIGAFDCKNIQTVDSEAFQHMTDLCFIDGMNGLGESFTSPQTIDFSYCTNLFIKANTEKFILNFAESLFNLSAGNKNGINRSTLKFKSAVQERSQNDDAIALMDSKGWTVQFVYS